MPKRNGTTVTAVRAYPVDKSGRVVIAKSGLDRLGIVPGRDHLTEEFDERNNRIILRKAV